ncbi:MAG: DUF7673 family protein [Gammaproteobacteria bacterium]
MNTVRRDPIDELQANLEKPLPRETYKNAIENLMDVAEWNIGGSSAAAQVLLSAYNGYGFHLDITDLCTLDYHYYACAIAVIRGRAELRIEPHELIENGDKRFRFLSERWRRLHITERGKREV